MPAKPRDDCLDFRQRRQEVAEQDYSCMPRQPHVRGQPWTVGVGVGQCLGQPVQAGAAGQRTTVGFHQRHPLAAAQQQRRQCQQEQCRTLLLFHRRQRRSPSHAGRRIVPEAHGLCCFPLGFPDEPPVRLRSPGFGGLAPVDAGHRIAGDEGAELPETVARADTPSAMHTLRHRRGNPLGGDQQRRQARGQRLGPARAGVDGGANQDVRPAGR